MPTYDVDTKMAVMLEKNFKYHAPKDDQQERYVKL